MNRWKMKIKNDRLSKTNFLNMIKAKFSSATKQEILERDNFRCIICWDTPHSIHHIYFSNEKNVWKDRNNAEFWATLCFTHHSMCHWCKRWEWIRQKVIDLVKILYN